MNYKLEYLFLFSFLLFRKNDFKNRAYICPFLLTFINAQFLNVSKVLLIH